MRSSPDRLPSPKSSELLAPEVADRFGVIDLGYMFPVAAEKSIKKGDGTNEVGSLKNPEYTLGNHKERVISTNVIRPSVFDESGPQPVGSTCMSMMNEVKVRKTPCRPPKHAGFNLVHRIPARRRPKAANFIPTTPPVYFSGAAHMKCRTLFESLDTVFNVADHAPADSQARLIFKILKAFFEVIGLKGQISIKLDQEIPIVELDSFISLIKSLDNSAPCFSKPSVRAMNNPNPRILLSILINDAPSSVCRAIIYYDPFLWKNRLMDHALDSESYISLFVSNRTYDQIICGRFAHILILQRIQKLS